jgi:hypothetical protein
MPWISLCTDRRAWQLNRALKRCRGTVTVSLPAEGAVVCRAVGARVFISILGPARK